MTKYNIEPVEIIRFSDGNVSHVKDLVSVEEPVSIVVRSVNENGEFDSKPLSITMRTPGNDIDLVSGFLFTEGVIKSREDIQKITIDEESENAEVLVTLNDDVIIDWKRLERSFYTSSSCGVCGKNSIEAVKSVCPIVIPQKQWQITQELLSQLPQRLRKVQAGFDQSGGIHAAAWFNLQGALVDFREDVGRHNALDKLIGALWNSNHWPLFNGVLLLSGRASFELVQKASMAGVRMICAIGAPSSLAIELAEEYGITLVGFLKSNRFNVYTSVERIQF